MFGVKFGQFAKEVIIEKADEFGLKKGVCSGVEVFVIMVKEVSISAELNINVVFTGVIL